MKSPSKYVMAVDGSSVFARSYYAVQGERAASAALRSLRNLIHSDRLMYPPTHILVGWEGDERRDKKRSPKPDGFHEQRLEFIETSSDIFGPIHYTPEVGEADDVVASVVYALREDERAVVVSQDKDLEQLATAKVDYYSLIDKRVLSVTEICAKWKVYKAEHIALILAITGDSVDAISGIPGYGPKKASKLMECVSSEMSLEDAYEALRGVLSPSNRNAFDASLNATLLFGLDSVPSPVPIVDALADLYD